MFIYIAVKKISHYFFSISGNGGNPVSREMEQFSKEECIWYCGGGREMYRNVLSMV
jgi:hypothetical protein